MNDRHDLIDIIQWLSKHCHFNKDTFPEKFQHRKIVKDVNIHCKDENNDKKITEPDSKDEKLRIHKVLKDNRIRLWGPDIPTIIESFEQLSTYKVKDQIINNLKEQGYKEPMPVQMQVWPLMFKERELLVTSPTGSGKTAAFLVPILHRLKRHKEKATRAVILAPTRELARQTYSECLLLSKNTGIEICLLNDVRNAIHKFNTDCERKYDILITTPKSLVFLIDQEVPFNLSKVCWLIIDESDRLFEDGSNGFREQIAVIYKACNSAIVCRALFSATVARDVQKWCKLTLNNVAMVTVGAMNTPCKDVKQELTYCGENEDDTYAKSLALNEIFQNGYEVPCIIFVSTKERAQSLFKDLILDRNVVAIHSDIPKRARDNLIKSFRMGKIFILICTDLISRGLDFRGVNLVINYDFPYNNESYIHRIGRTGRAGHKGKAITFWCKKDIPKLKRLATIINQSGSEVPDFMLNMKPSKNKRKHQLKKLKAKEEETTNENSNIKSDNAMKKRKIIHQSQESGEQTKKRKKIHKAQESGEQTKKRKTIHKAQESGEQAKKRKTIHKSQESGEQTKKRKTIHKSQESGEQTKKRMNIG